MSFRPSAVLLTLALLAPVTLSAQRVTADIAIGSGPVAGRIIIGEPDYYHGGVAPRHAPRYRPAVREVIVVRAHRGHGWYRRYGWRPVRVWYDASRRVYYANRPVYGTRGLRLVVVYERGGRYVFDDDDRGWRDADRRDRYDDDRYDDDRYDDEYRGADHDGYGRDGRGWHDRDGRAPERRDDRRH